MNVSPDHLESYVLGSLNWSGVLLDSESFRSSLSVYPRVLGNGHYHLPFFFVADLYHVLRKGYEVQFRSETKENFEDREARKLVMRYERECLGRILVSPEVAMGIEIAATSPDSDRVAERLLLQLLRKLAPHFPDTFQLNPGLLRGFQVADPEMLDPDLFSFGPLIEQFLGEINASLNWNQLLHEEDLFELSHLETLRNDHLRVGCRQILEVSRVLKSPEPIQLDLASHEDGADTAFLDETHYPTGGLSGLTNRGSFENLLTSELVYLDEGTQDVSLFELRYAEGELLYYLRDSGNLRRKRRSIHFIIDVGRQFELKRPGYRWQYSVLLQGLCLRLLHDLFEIFQMDALRFHFHYLLSGRASLAEREYFDGEIGMMRTVLSDYTKHGWVTFETVEEVDLATLIDPKRKSYGVIVSGPDATRNWEVERRKLVELELPLHSSAIVLDLVDSEDPMVVGLPSEGLGTEDLSQRKDLVLERLVS